MLCLFEDGNLHIKMVVCGVPMMNHLRINLKVTDVKENSNWSASYCIGELEVEWLR